MAATAPPAPGDDRGFTLLELILVLVLIGISTSLVLPRVGEFLFTDPLKAAARGLTGLIGRASQLAQQRQAPYLLKYIERDRRFVVEPEIPADAERTERSGPERAGELRDCIRDIRGLMEQQNVQRADAVQQDIIALAQDGLDAMAQVMYIRGGKMLGADAFSLPREGKEEPEEVLSAFLLQFYRDRMPAREVIVEAAGDLLDLEAWLRERREGPVTLSVPQRGDKRALVLTAKKNAEDALLKRNANVKVKEERTVGAVRELAEALELDFMPHRIEGFDISNTQGTLSVASMVVFIDGEPAKKEYRHFRIKTVEGANDFASMNEVLSRRFLRTQREKEEERWPLPDLVLVDGGPEQLRFARAAMLATGIEVPMFGLAKRLEEIYLPERPDPIRLDQRSPALHLIQRVRDESHRFAITHHRNLRAKSGVHSRLEDVPGIGPGRRRALLAHFRTMKAIGEATEEELTRVKGISAPAARSLYLALHADTQIDPAENIDNQA